MRYYPTLLLTIFVVAFLGSCSSTSLKCETVGEWKVQNYKVIKLKCPDLVLAFHFEYDVYLDSKKIGSGASQVDSCTFTWEADSENFLTFNICNNSIQTVQPNKIPLDKKIY
jgi:hypothetical protein